MSGWHRQSRAFERVLAWLNAVYTITNAKILILLVLLLFAALCIFSCLYTCNTPFRWLPNWLKVNNLNYGSLWNWSWKIGTSIVVSIVIIESRKLRMVGLQLAYLAAKIEWRFYWLHCLRLYRSFILLFRLLYLQLWELELIVTLFAFNFL